MSARAAAAPPMEGLRIQREPWPRSRQLKDMIWIPGGTFLMGSDEHYPEEAPAHPVSVSGFWIDRYQVTNAAFRRFVKATGYVTVAERVPDAALYPGALPEMLVPGSVVFKQPAGPRAADQPLRLVGLDARRRLAAPGGTRQYPAWPGASPGAACGLGGCIRLCCLGREKRSPPRRSGSTPAGVGTTAGPMPGGRSWRRRGKMLANYWQGEFPWQNLALDGFERTAPVGSFPPNGYGLSDMIGNAWEWTADWYTARHEVAVPAVARPLIREAAAGRGASIRTRPEPPSRARCSKAAPGPAPRTTASATVLPPACPTRSTPAPTTSASAVSCGVTVMGG